MIAITINSESGLKLTIIYKTMSDKNLFSTSGDAGKGNKPMHGVNWKKYYEKNPFPSPLEKKLMEEQSSDIDLSNGISQNWLRTNEDGEVTESYICGRPLGNGNYEAIKI